MYKIVVLKTVHHNEIQKNYNFQNLLLHKIFNKYKL